MNGAQWIATKVSDVSFVVRGITFPASEKLAEPGDGRICCLRTSNVQKTLDWSDIYFVPSSYVKRDEQLVRVGDILMSMANSYELVGKVARVLDLPYPAAFGAFLAAVRPTEAVDGRYLYHFLRSGYAQNKLREGSSQTTNIANISAGTLSQLEMPLAPLEEQRRIADKLDTVLARVDAVNERLARVAPLLKRLRQSVLAAATSGRLTEDWRSGADDDLLSNGLELPAGWRISTADQVCTSVRDGTHETPEYVDEGVPLITSKNIGPEGIQFATARLISQFDHDEISKRSAVSRGDILISMIGTVGQVCFVETDKVFSIKNVGLFKTSTDLCLPKYLFYWFQSPKYREWLQANMRGGSQKFISLGLLRKSVVFEPPLHEQTEIVRRVELLFAYADRLEARLRAAHTAAERLTPALLAKAFRGELVPQDPNDEPAAQLLQRLQASQATAAPQRRKARAAPVVQD